MGNEAIKVNCVLEGDSAIDFERLAMEFKIGQYAGTRPKQQAAMIGAAMLVLDANKQKCAAATGKRYPTLVELLEFAGIQRGDINKVLGLVEPPGEGEIGSLAATIAGAGKKDTLSPK